MPTAVSDYVADKVSRDLPGRTRGLNAAAPLRDDSVAVAMRLMAETIVGERGARDVRGVAEA
jgi:hypothetical protein